MIELRYRFSPDVRSATRDGNLVAIDVKDWKVLKFRTETLAQAEAILAMNVTGATLTRLQQIAAGSKAIAYYIERLSLPRLLAWEVSDEQGSLAHVESQNAGYRPREEELPAAPLKLSRFAYLQQQEGEFVLESASTRARIRLTPRGAETLMRSLARADTANEDEWAATLWRLGFADAADQSESHALQTWQFHDLLLHEQSRANRDGITVGGTYRFTDRFAAPPAIKPAMAGIRIALPPVDEASVRASSRSLHAMQAERRSLRHYADAALSLSALGEFLWRVGRTLAMETSAPKGQELMRRPYPAGGAINELEYYVAVGRCEGLEPAFYHYDSHAHALVRLESSEKVASRMIEESTTAMGFETDQRRPPVVMTIASRLPRLAWKYEGMAYRASLLHTGVVFHLMYLIATDMKLAACANGTSNSRLFEKATGLDRFEETAIGEFCLGVPVAQS